LPVSANAFNKLPILRVAGWTTAIRDEGRFNFFWVELDHNGTACKLFSKGVSLAGFFSQTTELKPHRSD
jgi:hypothetical protein